MQGHGPQEGHKAKQESQTDCSASAETIDQKIIMMEASLKSLAASIDEAEAERCRLRESTRRLQAAADLEEIETQKLAEDVRRYARESKYYRAILHRGEHASRLYFTG